MSNRRKVIIFGLSDTAELAFFYLQRDSDYEVAAFTVDRQYLSATQMCGKSVVPFDEVATHFPPEQYCFFAPMVAADMNRVRARVFHSAKTMGYKFISYISSKATNFSSSIGENCFILENNVLQPFCVISDNVMLWSGNHIGHHSTIESHVFVTSHVVVSGHVRVGQYSFIGVNAAIRDAVQIGEGCFVGMGAVVTKSTDGWTTVVGNPAREKASR